MDVQHKIEALNLRINALIQQHNHARAEITHLREELQELKRQVNPKNSPVVVKEERHIAATKPRLPTKPTESVQRSSNVERSRNLESFIGGKLINFIGITILVIGVSMGIKYAIDHDLIGAGLRVILGYVVGIGMVALAWRLKEKYAYYSAVMLGGGVAILYFNTYAAFSFYQLLPHLVAFGIMFLITLFTIWAAIQYNLQIIGIIGLAGAYAIPVLLSQDSGRIEILFTYMTIINIGILILAFIKNWKLLNYVAFGLSWMIFLSWYGADFEFEQQAFIAAFFASVFFLIFYMSFMAYKLLHLERFAIKDVVYLVLNTFVYYGIGYEWVGDFENGEKYLGLFTLVHAGIHLGVSIVLHGRKQADRNVYQLVSALVICFLTIAVPVQLNGNWVSLLWMALAVSLFAIGHFREVSYYKQFGHILSFFAFLSLIHDWGEAYPLGGKVLDSYSFIFNIQFFTSLFIISGLGGMYVGHQLKTDEQQHSFWSGWSIYGLPLSMTLLSYGVLFLEISQAVYFQYFLKEQIIDDIVYRNEDLLHFKDLWLMIYSFVFIAVLGLLNQRFWRSKLFARLCVLSSLVAIIYFSTQGIFLMNELRDSFLNRSSEDLFIHAWEHIAIRYLIYICLAGLVYASYFQIRLANWFEQKKPYWMLAMHLIILIVMSNELSSNILILSEQAAQSLAYKVGYSLLWAAYAILLIIIGIRKQMPLFRYAAFLLLAVTLFKVFFFDLSSTSTISRIMIFIGLGALLMLAAYLYQRFKEDL